MSQPAIDIWSTDGHPSDLELQILSAEEHARAARFVTETLRHRFIRARAGLRLRLAAATGQPANALEFTTGRYGKPELAAPEDRAPVWFNLSHSGDLAALAISRTGPVGIDIEAIRPVEALDLAGRFFAVAEHAALVALPEGERLAGFFRLWTAKEAVVKAIGCGLSCDPRSFDVSAILDADVATVTTCVPTAEPSEPATWQVRTLACAPSYAAAVATTASPLVAAPAKRT